MNGELFSIGDYVKFKETSKGGKEYYVHCVVLSVDESFAELINKFKFSNGPYNDDINYEVQDENVDTYKKPGHELEADIQAEREFKLNEIL